MCAPETHDDPWAMYEYLRENDPICWDEHNQDGAQHTKQRGLIAKGFTPRAMRESEEYCEKIVAELIDAFADSGETVALKPGGRHEWASSSFTRGPMHMDLVFG